MYGGGFAEMLLYSRVNYRAALAFPVVTFAAQGRKC
jgi:hypothetical protein